MLLEITPSKTSIITHNYIVPFWIMIGRVNLLFLFFTTPKRTDSWNLYVLSRCIFFMLNLGWKVVRPKVVSLNGISAIPTQPKVCAWGCWNNPSAFCFYALPLCMNWSSGPPISRLSSVQWGIMCNQKEAAVPWALNR